jgi:hypothetical protein
MMYGDGGATCGAGAIQLWAAACEARDMQGEAETDRSRQVKTGGEASAIGYPFTLHAHRTFLGFIEYKSERAPLF